MHFIIPVKQHLPVHSLPLYCPAYSQLHTNAEPGVVYEADSEDELMGTEGIAKKATGPGRYARYMMLHGLWASLKG